jgi:hypothetical protein
VASLIGVVDEKALIRFHPLRDAFRVIETIDVSQTIAGLGSRKLIIGDA